MSNIEIKRQAPPTVSLPIEEIVVQCDVDDGDVLRVFCNRAGYPTYVFSITSACGRATTVHIADDDMDAFIAALTEFRLQERPSPTELLRRARGR